MLYTQLLRDTLNTQLSDVSSLKEAVEKLKNEENVFFSENFLLPRPLLQALMSEKPVVLLIDEIDRADVEFEAFLLELLSDYQVSIPELGTIQAKNKPFVILTSNNTRELSEALKRRCLFLHIDYPSFDEELEIVHAKVPGIDKRLAKQAVKVVQEMRYLDLRKMPSISETIDWVKALVALNKKSIDHATLQNTLSVLLKHESDIAKARRNMQWDDPEDEDA